MRPGGVVAVWTIDRLGDFGCVERPVAEGVNVRVALRSLRAELRLAGVDCLKGEGFAVCGELCAWFTGAGHVVGLDTLVLGSVAA